MRRNSLIVLSCLAALWLPPADCSIPAVELLWAAQQAAGPREAAASGARAVAAVRTLVDERGGRLDWSRVSDQIVFGMFRRSGDRRADIYVMRSDGSGQRCLTCDKAGVPQAGNDQPVWHPSGRYIVFQSVNPDLPVPSLLPDALVDALTQGGAGFHNNLWAMTPDGREFHRLTDIGEGEATLHPQFSHDGRKLLWAAYERDGAPPARGGRWRGGRRARGGGGQWSLKIADFAEGAAPRLSNIQTFRPRGERQTFYEGHGFSPDDRKIIFSASIGREHPFDLDIWTLELAPSRLVQLTNSPGVWDEHAHYSPGGGHIAWISSDGFAFTPTMNYGRSLATELWIMRADGSEKRRLTHFNDSGHVEATGGRTIVADNAWNRDGSRIAAVLGIVGGDSQMRSRIALIDLGRQY